MKTQRVSVAEQKVRDAEEAIRKINRRILNAQAAIAIFPLLLGAMIALYFLVNNVLLAVVVGFGSILIAGIGIWLVENSSLAEERQRAWGALEAAWNRVPHGRSTTDRQCPPGATPLPVVEHAGKLKS